MSSSISSPELPQGTSVPSDEDYRLLVESVIDYAIFMIDVSGRITTWNAGAENVQGYAAHEIVGEHFSRVYPPDDAAGGKPARALAMARDAGRHAAEGWLIRKNGARFWASVVLTALRDGSGRWRGFAAIIRESVRPRELEEAPSQTTTVPPTLPPRSPPGSSPWASANPDPGRVLAGLRVLAVDDDPDANELVTDILTKAGAVVESAESALAALAALRRFRPHILLSDIGMPGEDGYSLIRRIRALSPEEGGRVPAIALTAYSRREDRTQALAAGFTTHLGKPVQPNDLVASLTNLAASLRR